MTELLRVGAADAEAVFDPEDGGRLVSFRVHGHELLVQHGSDVFHRGSFVIAPWTGRLRNATLAFGGREHRFGADSGSHALHGLVTRERWSVSGRNELSIELPEPWPWRGRVHQRLDLGEGSAVFYLALEAKEDMPAAMGWHPWFVRRLPGTAAEVEVDVSPGRMWENDVDGIPSGRLAPPPPRPWDYCFRDLAADPVLRWPGALELTVSSTCVDWVIYDEEEQGVCVEPWTGPPNSVNLPDPVVVRPGHPLTATMRWSWRILDDDRSTPGGSA